MNKLLSIIAICYLSSCSLITIQSPFADINNLGVILKPGESIIIDRVNSVKIEYSAETKRRVVYMGESREFSLKKSKELNGIYGSMVNFKEGSIGDVKGISYTENTKIFKTKEEHKRYLHNTVDGLGFEYRANQDIIFHCDINKGRAKYLYVVITKLVMGAER